MMPCIGQNTFCTSNYSCVKRHDKRKWRQLLFSQDCLGQDLKLCTRQILYQPSHRDSSAGQAECLELQGKECLPWHHSDLLFYMTVYILCTIQQSSLYIRTYISACPPLCSTDTGAAQGSQWGSVSPEPPQRTPPSSRHRTHMSWQTTQVTGL